MFEIILLSAISSIALSPVEINSPTSLLDIGLYEVGYQIEDKEKVILGVGWSQHFEEISGVSYIPMAGQDGVDSLLIHSPWKLGAGIAWADYFLRLSVPRSSKPRFIFQTAMLRREDVQRGSDGVTYSVFINGVEKFKKHVTSADWERYEIDLSEFAGKEFQLRLQVHPGPKGDASWDYSLWGNPRIEMNLTGKSRNVESSVETNPIELVNDRRRGVLPSVHGDYRNFLRPNGDKLELGCEAEDVTVRYVVEIKPGIFPAKVTARIGESQPFMVYSGGFVVDKDGANVKPENCSVVSSDQDGLAVRYEFRGKYAVGRFKIDGKTLLFEFKADGGWIARVNLGSPLAALRRELDVPYLSTIKVHYLPAQRAFVSTYLDFTRSNSSQFDGAEAVYLARTDGTRNDVAEVGVVTVAERLGEVLPNIPWQGSPYIAQIGDRAVFDIWGGHLGSDAKWVGELSKYGISKAIMIKHVWQRYGYDRHLPTTIPANEGMGGDEAAIALSNACRDAGWLFALHENYIDFYPKSHEWNPADVALDSNGEMRKAWYNRGSREQSYAYKSAAMAKYARKYSPEIHRRYRTTACFYDVNSCTPPWHHLDCDAAVPDGASIRGKIAGNIKLFSVAREAHEGPFFGEGNKHFWWAGLVDGVEAQLPQKEHTPWLVDFDLLKIHPQMVNHGMGYWERWQVDESSRWLGLPSPEKMDKYRAMELAFGHAAFIPTGLWHTLDWVLKEYYLTRPVQALYTDSYPRKILYHHNDSFLTVSEAIAQRAGFDRVYVEYESGLKLWVNGRNEDWIVRGRTIPQFGFLALSPEVEAWSLRRAETDVIADFCASSREGDRFIFANGRGFPPITSDFVEMTPSIKVENLGSRRIRIAYEFRIGATDLSPIRSRDLTMFVHFVDPDLAEGEGIVMQHDHKPDPPVAEWHSGSTVIDGPYEIELPDSMPDGEYRILLGLYDRSGRVKMSGQNDGRDRYLVGEMRVTGNLIEFDEPEEPRKIGVEGRVNFERTPVDFGPVVTSGMVIIRSDGADRLRIIVNPENIEFEIGLRTNEIARLLGMTPAQPVRVVAVGGTGGERRSIDLIRRDDLIEFRTSPGAIAYEISFR